MGEIAETAAKLVEPLGKLIDSVSGAIGKAYEPRHVRKMADAEAYRIKQIGEALRENSDIPIEYNPEGVSLSTVDFEQFLKRTQSRMAFQELKKQENIESVADKAYELLEGEAPVTAEPIEEDWMLRFFNCVEDISNEKMQELWATLLAGEVQHPGSFSLRTLERLRNLTQQEANDFQELCKHCVRDRNEYFIIHNEKYMKKYNIQFSSILKLEECGLINSSSSLSLKTTLDISTDVVLITDAHAFVVHNVENNKQFSLPVYPLTKSGAELARVVGCNMPLDELKDVAEIYLQESKVYELHLYPIVQMGNNEIVYNDDCDLLKR